MASKPTRSLLKYLATIVLVVFSFYYTSAKAEKEFAGSSEFKGYEVKFDYKGHPKEREIAYQYYKANSDLVLRASLLGV